MQRCIIQLRDTALGQHHDINARQAPLPQADGLAHQTLQSVTVHGAARMLLAEYEADPGMAQFVADRKSHQPFAMYLEFRPIEDPTIVLGIQ